MHARIATVFTRATRVVSAAMLFAMPVTTVSRTASDTNVRLYALDCGWAEFKDFGLGSDTGDYDGRPAELADPCFLTREGRLRRYVTGGTAEGAPLPRMTLDGQVVAQGSNAFQRSRVCSMS